MHLTEECPKLIQPREHKAKIQLWADITVSDMDAVNEAITVDQVKGELIRIFNLDDHKDNMKTAILLDLYYYTIMFTRENKYTREQASAFFSIIKRIHEVCIETPFGNVEHCFRYFRALVLCHAVKRPPYSIDLFTPEEVRLLTEYVINTYFRHFKMYKYVFTPLVRLDLSMTYSGLPPSPEPSEAGDVEAAVDDGEADGETAECETADGEIKQDDEEAPPEESAAESELRAMIRQHLEVEIKKLRSNVDDQIKQSEMNISKQIEASEGTPGAKGGRGSAKGKKK